MSAQLVRLNTAASNLANAGSVTSTAESAYRIRKPVFETMYDDTGNTSGATVHVKSIETIESPPLKRYEPGHPMADDAGYIYEAPVDPTTELVELLETSRDYQNNVEVLQTAKSLILNTLKLGQ